jgi:predicted ArsR family transcriptional regulator
MEPVTTIVSAIVPLIATKALEKGGEAFGESAYKKLTEMITSIRDKLKKVGREGILIDMEAEPTEDNQSELKTTLEQQMKKDDDFAQKLRQFVEQLKSEGVIPADSQNGDQYNNTFHGSVEGSAFGPNSTITNNR